MTAPAYTTRRRELADGWMLMYALKLHIRCNTLPSEPDVLASKSRRSSKQFRSTKRGTLKISSESLRLLNGQDNFAGGKQQHNAFLNAIWAFLKCYVAVIFRQALNTFKIVKIPSREVIRITQAPAYPHPRPPICPHQRSRTIRPNAQVGNLPH